MPQPIDADTVSEETAQPDIVDYPETTEVRELPAQRTESPDVEDTGSTWEQKLPGEKQGMPPQDLAKILATRVSNVSDSVIFGAAELGPNEDVFQLVPAHRDRIRVTLEAIIATGEPTIYIGSNRNLNAGANAWELVPDEPITFHTRDAIYCITGDGSDTSRIQWAVEMRDESAVL